MDTQATANGWGEPPVKAPKRRRRVRLDTIADTRAEAARIYRKAVNGEVKIEDMSRLINALSVIGRMTIDSDLEARLEALEAG